MSFSLLDIVNITEKAAIASFPFIGSMNKNKIDKAATDIMRKELNELNPGFRIAIGEGEMDEAPMLNIGEELGKSRHISYDIAVDPIDGTTPASKSQDDSISVIALTEKGGFLHAPDMYMKKCVYHKKYKGLFSIGDSFESILSSIIEFKQLKGDYSQLTIVIQDRERHKAYIDIVNKYNGKVILFKDGDIFHALKPILNPESIDLFFNIGGAPEGVILAAAVKCLDGEIQGQLFPQNETEVKRCSSMNIENLKHIYYRDELVSSDVVYFVGTAVTKTDIIPQIKKINDMYITYSVALDNRTGSLRIIKNSHKIDV